jgi:hypothetical protein
MMPSEERPAPAARSGLPPGINAFLLAAGNAHYELAALLLSVAPTRMPRPGRLERPAPALLFAKPGLPGATTLLLKGRARWTAAVRQNAERGMARMSTPV